MCCSEHATLNVPPPVIGMLARYRQMQRTQGHGWGEDSFPDMFTWARFSLLGEAFDEFAASGDWAQAVRAAVGAGRPAPGIVVASLDADGGFDVARGPPLTGLPGRRVIIDLIVLADADRDGDIDIDGVRLESTPGEPLWHAHDHTALAGHEFRNGLLGHLHGMGLRDVPDPAFTDDESTPHPHDWPPNAAACQQMKDLGATVTYAHPAASALDEVEQLYAPMRTVEAREFVADAALSLVDTMEIVSCFDDAGAVRLWHHLLNCGLRLTATAGTDVFLSFAHGPGVASNPPGWGRMYAHLGDAALTVDAYRDAIIRGRILPVALATNRSTPSDPLPLERDDEP